MNDNFEAFPQTGSSQLTSHRVTAPAATKRRMQQQPTNKTPSGDSAERNDLIMSVSSGHHHQLAPQATAGQQRADDPELNNDNDSADDDLQDPLASTQVPHQDSILLETLTKHISKTTKNLTALCLSNLGLTTFDTRRLAGMMHLAVIDLSNNKLETAPVFHHHASSGLSFNSDASSSCHLPPNGASGFLSSCDLSSVSVLSGDVPEPGSTPTADAKLASLKRRTYNPQKSREYESALKASANNPVGVFPALWSIDLSNNKIRTIPHVAVTSPMIGHYNIEQNPVQPDEVVSAFRGLVAAEVRVPSDVSLTALVESMLGVLAVNGTLAPPATPANVKKASLNRQSIKRKYRHWPFEPLLRVLEARETPSVTPTLGAKKSTSLTPISSVSSSFSMNSLLDTRHAAEREYLCSLFVTEYQGRKALIETTEKFAFGFGNVNGNFTCAEEPVSLEHWRSMHNENPDILRHIFSAVLHGLIEERALPILLSHLLRDFAEDLESDRDKVDFTRLSRHVFAWPHYVLEYLITLLQLHLVNKPEHIDFVLLRDQLEESVVAAEDDEEHTTQKKSVSPSEEMVKVFDVIAALAEQQVLKAREDALKKDQASQDAARNAAQFREQMGVKKQLFTQMRPTSRVGAPRAVVHDTLKSRSGTSLSMLNFSGGSAGTNAVSPSKSRRFSEALTAGVRRPPPMEERDPSLTEVEKILSPQRKSMNIGDSSGEDTSPPRSPMKLFTPEVLEEIEKLDQRDVQREQDRQNELQSERVFNTFLPENPSKFLASQKSKRASTPARVGRRQVAKALAAPSFPRAAVVEPQTVRIGDGVKLDKLSALTEKQQVFEVMDAQPLIGTFLAQSVPKDASEEELLSAVALHLSIPRLLNWDPVGHTWDYQWSVEDETENAVAIQKLVSGDKSPCRTKKELSPSRQQRAASADLEKTQKESTGDSNQRKQKSVRADSSSSSSSSSKRKANKSMDILDFLKSNGQYKAHSSMNETLLSEAINADVEQMSRYVEEGSSATPHEAQGAAKKEGAAVTTSTPEEDSGPLASLYSKHAEDAAASNSSQYGSVVDQDTVHRVSSAASRSSMGGGGAALNPPASTGLRRWSKKEEERVCSMILHVADNLHGSTIITDGGFTALELLNYTADALGCKAADGSVYRTVQSAAWVLAEELDVNFNANWASATQCVDAAIAAQRGDAPNPVGRPVSAALLKRPPSGGPNNRNTVSSPTTSNHPANANLRPGSGRPASGRPSSGRPPTHDRPTSAAAAATAAHTTSRPSSSSSALADGGSGSLLETPSANSRALSPLLHNTNDSSLATSESNRRVKSANVSRRPPSASLQKVRAQSAQLRQLREIRQQTTRLSRSPSRSNSPDQSASDSISSTHHPFVQAAKEKMERTRETRDAVHNAKPEDVTAKPRRTACSATLRPLRTVVESHRQQFLPTAVRQHVVQHKRPGSAPLNPLGSIVFSDV